jgi:carbamoyl-phosphate synthase large subunit
VLAVVERERAAGADVACLVQFGGQTPLKLSTALHNAGVAVLGTSPDSIDLAEDRKRFAALLHELDIPQPPSGTASSRDEARDVAASIGFPVVVRPSYVLGGRAMAIVYDPGALDRYMTTAVDASPEHPVLIDRFLEDAFELDVDAVGDATGAVVVAGIMEHIEEAGIHSGDSSCVVPPFMVDERHIETIRQHTRRIARALGVVGLMNAQFAIKGSTVYVLEVNPRASRTVPYLSKATGVPLARIAARVMGGRTRADLGFTRDLTVNGVFVKSPVFPFVRFPGVDTILGPEMKSTGEVMGGAATFGEAFAKAQMAVGQELPVKGTVFISVNNSDKPNVLPVARDLLTLGFTIVATRGTAAYLRAHGVEAATVFKVNEGRPNVADQVVNGNVPMIINTPLGRASFFDDRMVRRAAVLHGVPCITTLTGAAAAVSGIRALCDHELTVRALQDYHAESATPPVADLASRSAERPVARALPPETRASPGRTSGDCPPRRGRAWRLVQPRTRSRCGRLGPGRGPERAGLAGTRCAGLRGGGALLLCGVRPRPVRRRVVPRHPLAVEVRSDRHVRASRHLGRPG